MRGYAVVETSDGEQALKQIDESIPDILLLDLNMPVLDGFGTVRAMFPIAKSTTVSAPGVA